MHINYVCFVGNAIKHMNSAQSFVEFIFSQNATKIDKIFTINLTFTKGSSKSEETGGFSLLQNKYSKSLLSKEFKSPA